TALESGPLIPVNGISSFPSRTSTIARPDRLTSNPRCLAANSSVAELKSASTAVSSTNRSKPITLVPGSHRQELPQRHQHGCSAPGLQRRPAGREWRLRQVSRHCRCRPQRVPRPLHSEDSGSSRPRLDRWLSERTICDSRYPARGPLLVSEGRVDLAEVAV